MRDRCPVLPVFVFCLASGLSILPGLAFNGHQVTEGPVTLRVESLPLITEPDQARTFKVWVTNSASHSIRLQLRFRDLVDPMRLSGPGEKQLEVPPRGVTQGEFAFLPGDPGYSGLYPLHVDALFALENQEYRAHAVQIVETRLPARVQPILPVALPPGGALSLATLKPVAVSYRMPNGPEQMLGPGWQGQDEASGTSFSPGSMQRSGISRNSLQVHPPWRKGPGTLFLDYDVQLPEEKPLRLTVHHAMRDTVPPEPPSDGITFRVLVGSEQVLERHVSSRDWVESTADLDRFAGRQIRLRLESHPGPAMNTTCDSGFWGDPVVASGARPQVLTALERNQMNNRARGAISCGRSAQSVHVFSLKGGLRAAVVSGPNGIADAVIAFGSGEQAVCFSGFRVALADQVMGGPAAPVSEVQALRLRNNQLEITHQVRTMEGPVVLKALVFAEGPALKVRITSPGRISDLALNSADTKAARVFYGHGYCLVDPGPFRAGGGGHNLATSHIACEFPNGIALLTACVTPPDFFQVDPNARLYALHTHPDTTFTLVPSLKGAFDAAFLYRPLYDKKPAPALAGKAGRFVFDLWGGRYADDTRLMQRCFDYGLTNSLAIMHVWQRWGYDYRLPDIYPPLPSLGTLEDLQAFGRTCDAAGVPWGVHDNYIDIYPDATGFSYDTVTFHPDGTPRKAWFNEGRQAQSYQFRPDQVQPFLERNMELIEAGLNPSASFVDVWTSINAFDYYDRQGRFHSKTETLEAWGKGFAFIRDHTRGGPTTSEAGSDQLIGWLEGADCQFLRASPTGGRFRNTLPCADWERVPWFNAVNHARFSLHGVGYSDRYQGGLSRDLHGIESDDYIGAEILTGNDLMIDLRGLVRGAVRKYWLAQDYIQSLALSDLTACTFAGGDLHHVETTWSSGSRAWINRGTNDWHVQGRILPPNGYYARSKNGESSIERLGGQVVEQSRAGKILYVNGRGYLPEAPLAIRPEALRLEQVGERSFKLEMRWTAEQPAPRDLHVFYHVSRQVPGYYSNVEFAGGGSPATPTSAWSGEIITGKDWVLTMPSGFPLGESEVLVGLYDPSRGGRRYRLEGKEVGDRRFRVATVRIDGTVTGAVTNITGFTLSPLHEDPTPSIKANRAPTDFGGITTSGGLRLLQERSGWTLIPLPDGDSFVVTLEPRRLRTRAIRRITPVSKDGKLGREIRFESTGDSVRFTTDPAEFGYRIE